MKTDNIIASVPIEVYELNNEFPEHIICIG